MPAEQRAFLDSNIVLYALGTDLLKKQAAWRILFQFPLISPPGFCWTAFDFHTSTA